MRSRLGLALLAFAAGVCALQRAPLLPPWPWLFVLAGGVGLAWFAPLQGWRGGVGLALTSLVLGIGYAGGRAEVRLAEALPVSWEGRVAVVTGVIDDLPSTNDRGTRFAFAVERAEPAHAPVPERLSLAWFAGMDGDDEEATVPPLRAGERWTLRLRLKRPHGNVNPGGFDLEAWLLQHGFRATGYVVRDARNARVDAFAGRAVDFVQRAREAVRTRIMRALGDAPYAGVIVALTIGDQRAVPEAQWTVFNRTGVGHLVSISGLHVTVFASLAGGLAFALARRSVRLTSRWPARRAALVVGVACAGAYTLLAGAEIPAVRTFAMLAIAACGIWLGRPGTAGVVWLWALAGVLAWDPWAPLTPGFWLSYGAVGLLLYAAVGRLNEGPAATRLQRAVATVQESAQAQWIVTVGLTPLTLALFAQTSIVAPLANAVAIPVVTLGVVPLALLGIGVPFAWPFQAAHAVLAPLMLWLEALSRWPEAAWQQHVPSEWAVGAGIVGVLWILAPRGVPGRALGMLWLLPLFLARPSPPGEGAFRMTVLDAGQGLAVVIETRSRTLVYDTGPGYHDTADAGGRIVAPFLRAIGRPHVDAIVVSHQDLDHSGGALSLMRALPFGSLLSSLEATHPIALHAGAAHDTERCTAGQAWTWDSVHFTMLHPTLDEYDDPRGKSNDRSCVLRVEAGGGSALLAGDVEAISEARLVRKMRSALRADVLVVPHHGSRTSSTLPFIRAVAPAYAVMAAGHRNRFGHPKPDIVARYTAFGARVVRTDAAGAITFTFHPGRAPYAVGARALRRRYWLDDTGAGPPEPPD